MTNPYRAMLAEMAAELDWIQQLRMHNRTATHPLADRARVLLDQQEPEGLTDEKIPDNYAGHEKGFAQEHLARLMCDAIGTETNHNAYIVAAGRILDRPEFACVARWGHPTPQPEPEVLNDKTREAVITAVAEALGDAYDCLRVWSAWGCGTMGPDDFYLVAEDADRVSEIADAAIEAIRPTPQPEELQP